MKQRRTKRKGRILAWLLAFSMAFSMVSVPIKTQAEDAKVTVENNKDSTTGVWLTYTSELEFEANCWGTGSPAADLYKYEFVLHNASGGMISDWTINITGSSTPVFNKGWNGVAYTEGSKTITIGTYQGVGEGNTIWTNKEIANGATAQGMGMQVDKAFMDNAKITITYRKGTSTEDISQDDTLTDPAAIGKTSDKVTATLVSTNIDGTYHEYAVQVNNGLTDSISDWLIAVPVQGISSMEDWSEWARVSAHYTSEYLYITPSPKVEAEIAGGGKFGDVTITPAEDNNCKINYKGSNDLDASKAVVYYKADGTTGDFDKVIENAAGAGGGSGSGGGGGTTSDPFDGSNIGSIDTSQSYNFAKLLQLSLYFYDANMCGDKVSERSLFSKELYDGWRGDCHKNDEFTYNGKTYSAVGGYHDAGDHVKFGLPMAEAFSTLGIGYMEFSQAFTELGQTQHFKTIVDHYCDYVKRCTVLESGEVQAFCYQVGNGDSDHAQWGPPETENETATKRSFTLVATSENPATDIVSETAAALAIHYINFNNAEDLEYAEKLFAFAMSHDKKVGTKDGGFYGSTTWEDDYCLAAAMLYKATGKEIYKTQYNKENKNSGNLQKPYDWDNVYQAAALYAPQQSSAELSSMAGFFNDIANANSSKYYCHSTWGSARYNCNVQLMMLVYDKLKGESTYQPWAKYQMSMILGNNSTKKNLIVGYNDKSPKQPHHRAASGQTGWDKFNSNIDSVYTLFGALVGGPGSSDFSSYEDKMTNDHTNEVTLDYNAGLVGAAAALYLAYKDSTEEGFTEQTLLKDFYGGSEFSGSSGTDPVAVTGVTLDKSTLALTTNGDNKSATLKATVLPVNAANKNVTWTSSDDTVATVDSKGTVTAMGNGTATITVTTDEVPEGGTAFTASCEVTVTTKVTGITLDKTALELAKGDTAALTAAVVPANATNKAVTWSSDNTDVVTVTGDGLSATVTAVGGGTAVITVKAVDGSLKAECKVTVNVPVTGVTLDKSTLALVKSDDKNNTAVLTAEVLPADAVNKEVTWSVTPEDIVTVEPDSENSCTAVVTAAKSGTATVTVTTADGAKTAECIVTVTNPITGIAFESDSMELGVNEKASLAYTVTPPDGDKVEVTCESSNTEVVAIGSPSALDDSGSGSVTLTGGAKGSADITVSVTVNGNKITHTCTVSVVGKKVESVTMKKDGVAVAETDEITLDAKSETTLTELGLSAEVAPSDADNQTVTWSIADKSIATIADGTITAHKAGTTKLTAKAGNKTAECTLVVNKIPQAMPKVTWATVKRTSNALTAKATCIVDTDSTSGILEYSKDDGATWQAVPEGNVISLTGLEAFTMYELQVRLKGDDIYEASDIASEKYAKYTLVEDAYTIDISRLPDENYIDALRTAEESGEGHRTAEFSKTDMTLTLTDTAAVHEAGYVITGSSPEITIVVPDGVKAVTLDAVTCKGIVANGNQALTLTITGENRVTEAVTEDAASEVTIQGSGSLDTKLICVDTLTVTGGTVTVTNPNAEGVGIQAGTITVTGGEFTVNAEGTAIKTDGSVTISDGTVTVTSGGTAIEAGDSVSISGGEVTLTVTGEDTKAVVSAENEISLTGGTVSTVKPEGNTEIFDFSVGDDGKIVVDGVELQGTPSYSKTPVDKDGHEIKYITVKFVESGKAEPLLVLSKKAGSELDLGECLKDYAVSKAGYELTWSADGKTYRRTDKMTLGNTDCTLTAVWTKLVVSMENVTAAAVADQTYTGSEICPKPVLTYGGAALTEGTDYTLSYQNNINAGAAVITATGQGAFTGSKTITFAIVPKTLDGIIVQIGGEQPYTGKAVTPIPEVYDGTVRLEENKDYTVAYSNNINAGTAAVIVTGMGNYTGLKQAAFSIVIQKNATYTVGNYKYKVTNATSGKGTVTLTKAVKKAKTVNIGSTVNIGGVSFKITAIGDKAFKGNTKMTTLKIGKNVTTIGANAFYGCTKLKTATIDSGVKKIGKKAFYNCKAMTKLTISSKKLTKKNIGSGAFTKMGAKNYKKLTVKVPKSKLKAYKTMLQAKGLSKKAKIKK